MSEEWSYDRKFQQFEAEIRDRFIKERDFWHKVHDYDLELARAKNPDFDQSCKGYGIELTFDPEMDCPEWNLYINTKIIHDHGMIRIILDSRYRLRPEWCELFNHTSVAWSLPGLMAEVIDSEPRVVLEIMMIDDWSDEREAEWHKTHKWEPDHKYNLNFFNWDSKYPCKDK